MKRILFNATQSAELRVAIVDGQQLYDLDIEHLNSGQKKSNVYKGVIHRVEPSLEAAFVDYGADRHGFLPLKDIASSYFNSPAGNSERVSIKQAVREGQEIIVQVDKEERGNKGAALNTNLSLAGRYLVLMPTTPSAGGVSRKIEGQDRDDVRDLVAQLVIPEGMGIIARTVAIGRKVEELQWDLDHLVELWDAIRSSAEAHPAPFLLYKERNAVVRAIRDYLREDVAEILVDDAEIYEEARSFMEQLLPQSLPKLKLYQDKVPLFTRYQIEHQIEQAYERVVSLPSGGSIVIDHTEALTSIDINSARATQGSNIEETAVKTNLEAADEIGRQLRLRDLGGLIVIDFIDMLSNRNQKDVENRLRDAVRNDRARVQIGKLSRFGLLEMSRQRLKASLKDSSHITCPRCSGQGSIRNLDSMSIQILRLIESEAGKEQTARITVQVPVEVATCLFNEKRDALIELDKRLGAKVIILPNPAIESPHFVIQRIRAQDMSLQISESASYELPKTERIEPVYEMKDDFQPSEKAAVVPIRRPPPAPVKKGLLSKIFGGLMGESAAKKTLPSVEVNSPPTETRQRQTQQRHRQGNSSRNRADQGGSKPKQESIEEQGQGRSRSKRGGASSGRRRKPDSQQEDQQTQNKSTERPSETPQRARRSQPKPAADDKKAPDRTTQNLPGDDDMTLRPETPPIATASGALQSAYSGLSDSDPTLLPEAITPVAKPVDKTRILASVEAVGASVKTEHELPKQREAMKGGSEISLESRPLVNDQPQATEALAGLTDTAITSAEALAPLPEKQEPAPLPAAALDSEKENAPQLEAFQSADRSAKIVSIETDPAEHTKKASALHAEASKEPWPATEEIKVQAARTSTIEALEDKNSAAIKKPVDEHELTQIETAPNHLDDR